ncbi:hypothetical protein UFOVP937_2 [uncultured Caudovirales phage]|uniref:Uncharacterized protein n=1 Tax=uncultured Caudovirales phage TaxID=2100421 RepID=A0A6J5PMU3_9CAUD|nr:hypothetical protein UFOVP937_2 [uncultured Caudovirales phage]CAB4214451.1 hypothetical protein UFOVP1465_43 [uncultured Caudovirales phage]
MAKNLARILDSDMPRLPLRKAAEQLRKKGRGRDTMLAHITPEEAKLLKARGGRGTINPDTGLPEFDFWDTVSDWFSPPPTDTSSYQPTVQQPEFTGYQEVQGPIATQTAQPFSEIGSPEDFRSNMQDYQYLQNAGLAEGGQYTPANYEYAGLTAPSAANVAGVSANNFNNFLASTTPPAAASSEYQLTPEQQKEIASDLEGQPIDLTTKVPSTGGVDTPFGKLGLKELIAALGVGGMGLSYLNAQSQGKKAAGQLQGAYNQAAQQQMQLAQPYMQQGGTQLAGALTGALSPAQQQQLQAAQAAAAQGTSGAGGAGAAQAGRSIEDLRQRLLSNQQTMALQLLGAGTPLVGQAIQNQLSGTTTGINTQMALSQQAGQAATGMLGMLAMMYGRSA